MLPEKSNQSDQVPQVCVQKISTQDTYDKSQPLPEKLDDIPTAELERLSNQIPFDMYFHNMPINTWANHQNYLGYLNYQRMMYGMPYVPMSFNPHMPIFENENQPFTFKENIDLERTKEHEEKLQKEYDKYDNIVDEIKRRKESAKEDEYYNPNFTMNDGDSKHDYNFRKESQQTFIDDMGNFYLPNNEKRKYYKEEGYYAKYNHYMEIKDEYFLQYLSSLLDMLKPKYAPSGKRGKPSYNDRDMLFCAIVMTYNRSNPRHMVGHFPDFYKRHFIYDTPRHNKMWKTVGEPSMTPILQALVQLSAFPMLLSEDIMAVDSSGFTTITRGDYRVDKYVRDMDDLPKRKKNGEPVIKTKKEIELEEKERLEWMKLHIIIGVETGAIGMAQVTNYYGDGVGDSSQFPTLLKGVTDLFHAFRIEVPMKFVTGDKAYGGEYNYEYSDQNKLILLTPYKDNVDRDTKTSAQWIAMYDFAKEHPIRWGKLYHKRSNVEAHFHSIKAMLGEKLTEKNDVPKMNKLYMRCICHNILQLIQYNVLNGCQLPTPKGVGLSAE